MVSNLQKADSNKSIFHCFFLNFLCKQDFTLEMLYYFLSVECFQATNTKFMKSLSMFETKFCLRRVE